MVCIRPLGQVVPGFLYIFTRVCLDWLAKGVHATGARRQFQASGTRLCVLTVIWRWVGFGWAPVGVDNVGHRQPRHASGPVGQERPPASLLSRLPIIRAALSAGFQLVSDLKV